MCSQLLCCTLSAEGAPLQCANSLTSSPPRLQALHSVATVFLSEEDLPPNLRAGIVDHMVGVHQSMRQFSTKFEQQLRRHNYVTVSVAETYSCSWFCLGFAATNEVFGLGSFSTGTWPASLGQVGTPAQYL